jgi:hypothetical protein
MLLPLRTYGILLSPLQFPGILRSQYIILHMTFHDVLQLATHENSIAGDDRDFIAAIQRGLTKIEISNAMRLVAVC